MHAVADGTPESVEVDLEVIPGRVRRSLLHQMAQGERVVIRTRQHPMVLARHVVWPALAVLVWCWFVFEVQPSPGLVDLATLAVLIGAGRLAWMELHRRYTWWVVTDKRILKHEGIFTRTVPMMRLIKVTDMTYHRPLVGEVTGFGTIIIESAGQEQAFSRLTYLPDPDDVNAALNAVIFGEKPRRKKGVKDRPWPRMRPARPSRGAPDEDGGDQGGTRRGPRGGGPGGGSGGGATGAIEVRQGYPAMPRTEPESWYRSSTLRGSWRLGDTGEIPVVSADDAAPFDQEAAPLAPAQDALSPTGTRDQAPGAADTAADSPLDAAREAPDGERSPRRDQAREIPLYPPREWIENT